MVDRRTKRQKVQAMADQTVSPEEADVAKKMLETMPPDPDPVRPRIAFSINGGHSRITVIHTPYGIEFRIEEY